MGKLSTAAGIFKRTAGRGINTAGSRISAAAGRAGSAHYLAQSAMTGGFVGGLYGLLSEDTSVIGGAIGGATLGAVGGLSAAGALRSNRLARLQRARFNRLPPQGPLNRQSTSTGIVPKTARAHHRNESFVPRSGSARPEARRGSARPEAPAGSRSSKLRARSRTASTASVGQPTASVVDNDLDLILGAPKKVTSPQPNRSRRGAF